MKYADLAFRRRTPTVHDGLFTFSIPQPLESKISPGCLVAASLQGQPEVALVVRIHEEKPLFETEPIHSICTPPLLDTNAFKLAKRVAEKTLVPLARVLPLFLPSSIFSGNGQPPLVTSARLTKAEAEKLGKKMQQVVDYLQNNGESEIALVREETGSTKATLDRLQEKGVIEFVSQPKFVEQLDCPLKSEGELSAEQAAALASLAKHQRALLFAPTGSGKSHVARKLASDTLESGKTVFFLVPEIGLTTELLEKCEAVFGKDCVALYHSRLSEGEKAQVFWRVKCGHARVVVGSRAACFLPFQNLGLIVMEEEHEWTFKSDQSPRYHARDVAEALAKIHQAQLIYATATPSLELWHAAHNKATHIARLPARAALPQLSVIDLREEMAAKNTSPISRSLKHKVELTLQAGKQALLFLNRRGLFRCLVCEDCGEVTRCPECNIALVSHAGKGGKEYLLCHQCGRVFGVMPRCTSCGSSKLRFFGSGTAQIERVVKLLFPDKKVVRIDRDTTSAKAGFKELHETFTSGDADILVGTQIIAKGLDFANVGVVGILDADAGLSIPDFRAAERTYQLLIQVSGRAGRRGQTAEVVIQTRLPELPLWQTLKTGNPDSFYQQEIQVRQQHFLPPVSRIAKLIFSAKTKDGAFGAARKLEAILNQRCKEIFADEKIQIFVAPALHPKKHGKFFANLFIIAAEPEKILCVVPLPHCRIDIDPVDVVS